MTVEDEECETEAGDDVLAELRALLTFNGDDSWKADAACRDDGLVDLFFPEEDETSRFAAEMAVRRYCEWCPVRSDCLEYAVVNPGLQGMWGGVSAREVARQRAARRRTA